MRKIFNLTLAIILVITFASPSVSNAETKLDLIVSKDSINYDESFVFEVKNKDGIDKDKVEEIIVDAKELGIEKEFKLDLDLLATSLSVSQEISPGEKTISMIVKNKDGTDQKFDYKVKVEDKESKGFSWDEAIIYFMLTDRFNNGDPTNDDPHGINYDKDHLESYHGGDFKGIIDKLDYLKELGINTIWITPIVDNIEWNLMNGKGTQYGYHGYWAKDFTKIDEHLGDVETFKELLDQAHDRGIKIMVDVVINHTGYGLKESDNSTNIPNYPTQEDRERFKGMLRTNPKAGDLITGELAGLPDFKTEEDNVRKQVIAWQKAWIENTKTEKGNTIDYFRVDTVKHLDKKTLLDFKNEIIKTKPDFRMIGEFFDGNAFMNGQLLHPSLMDSVLDFDFKKVAKAYTIGNFRSAEKQLLTRNKKINNYWTTGHFLSSHDEDGFLAVRLSGDEGLFKIASSLQLTAKGQPVIYYGEEIGMSGKAAGDFSKGEFGENRYDFDWSKVENNHMLDHYKKLLAIRNSYTNIFTDGTRESLVFDKKQGISVFERALDQEGIIVSLNIKDEEASYNLTSKLKEGEVLKDLYTDKEYTVGKGGQVTINVPGKDEGGTSIIYLEQAEVKAEIVEAPERNQEKDESKEGVKADKEDKKAEEKERKINPITPYILLVSGILLVLLAIFYKKKTK